LSLLSLGVAFIATFALGQTDLVVYYAVSGFVYFGAALAADNSFAHWRPMSSMPSAAGMALEALGFLAVAHIMGFGLFQLSCRQAVAAPYVGIVTSSGPDERKIQHARAMFSLWIGVGRGRSFLRRMRRVARRDSVEVHQD